MRRALVAVALICASLSTAATAQALRAGAARIDITPDLADLPKPFTRIRDRLYVRALVLDSDGKRVAIVIADLPTITAPVFADLNRQVAAAIGAPVEHVMIGVTHTHNAVRLDANPTGIILPGSAKITAQTVPKFVEAVRQATAALRPARIGHAAGIFHLAGPRMTADIEGPASAEPMPRDRTIGVVKVEGNDGKPIAFLINNGPNPILAMEQKSDISADVAGVVQRHIEQRFGDEAVALYTVGAPPGVLYDARRQVAGASPVDPYALMEAVGTLVAEEVIVAQSRAAMSSNVRLGGTLATLQCSGKATTPFNLPDRCSNAPGSKLPACVFTDRDAPPSVLHYGLIRIGGLSLFHTDANLTTAVWEDLRPVLPHDTLHVSLVFGPMRFVVDDKAYARMSYPATATTAKRGCAEQGLRRGLRSLGKVR